jgi:hypothetical protein
LEDEQVPNPRSLSHSSAPPVASGVRPAAPSRLRRILVAIAAVAALAAPATAQAGAEQLVIPVVDEPVTFEFPDPCRGGTLQAEATESGVIRVTELGDRGHHVRVNLRGTADLYDEAGILVGTWTYHLRFADQLPPGSQGAVMNIAVGPVQYADGSRAIVQGHQHEVFGKGDVLKWEFFKTVCGGV